MGILEILFGKKEKHMVASTRAIQSTFNDFMIHSDLKDLLWIADGPQKNYAPRDSNQFFEYNGIRISFSSFSSLEPSLISVKLSIQEVSNPQKIDRPPYFPTYIGLTNEQRGVYWKLLENPYGGNLNIGYVFILYYGLERHLLEGNFERAFHVILKLRDVYDNSSFQSYSACSLILACLVRQRPDLAMEFYNSIDKNYELKFSDNLYLLCKMGLHIPLTSLDIIRMAKTFEFNNQNYIKKYPDLFINIMRETMQAHLGGEELDINKYITPTEWKKLRKQATPIFANISIREQAVDIPIISESFKLKKAIYDLLEQTHENVKLELAKMRKEGVSPAKNNSAETKEIEILAIDNLYEQELLSQYENAHSSALDKHFALIQLQDFYYKYRDLDGKYLQICIDYCNEDISLLPQIQSQYVRAEKENILHLSNIYNKKEIADRLSSIRPFNGNIPAFKRLSIIFEKCKQYQNAIEVCNNAISYYSGIGSLSEITDFEIRKRKIESKAAKV